MTVQMSEMMASMCKKIVLELLSAYGSPQLIWQYGEKSCQLGFIESIYWHYIWVIDPNSSNSWQNRQMLDGSSIQEIIEKIYTAFKRSCWLESTLRDGKTIVVKLGDGTGKPEEFMIKYELLGISISKEEAIQTSRTC